MPNRTRSPFAQALKRYRKIERRLTQVEYAAELGINSITLSRYERDASPVGDDWVAAQLERVTGIAPPRTNAELSALLERAESRRPGVSPDVVAEVSEATERRGGVTPKRRPRGRGRA